VVILVHYSRFGTLYEEKSGNPAVGDFVKPKKIPSRQTIFFAARPENLALGRVARWLIFKPKIPIWVIFSGP
jgi:hypothetical protein